MEQLWADHRHLPNGRTQVGGHPTVEMELREGERRITVCAECESVRSILFLSKDRWYCTTCRNSGAGGSTLIPVARPGRRA